MYPYDGLDEYEYEHRGPRFYVENGRKGGHPLGAGYPHIPNKQEAKELRRLMAKFNKSAEEVRADIENRRKLAKAAKSPMVGNSVHRNLVERKKIQKRISRRRGLPGYHPDVQEELNAQMQRNGIYRSYY
jgi:hypothetical protein